MKSVYVMKSDGAYKIGVSQNPCKRLHDLKIGNCHIELIYESKKLSNAYTVERALHKKFDDCAMGREWFSVSNEDRLIDYVRSTVDKIGVCIATEKATTLSAETKIDSLIDWVLCPERDRLSALCKEIDKIAGENKVLAKRLICSGWTEEEVEALIASAYDAV